LEQQLRLAETKLTEQSILERTSEQQNEERTIRMGAWQEEMTVKTSTTEADRTIDIESTDYPIFKSIIKIEKERFRSRFKVVETARSDSHVEFGSCAYQRRLRSQDS
jgi:hypothetical protein